MNNELNPRSGATARTCIVARSYQNYGTFPISLPSLPGASGVELEQRKKKFQKNLNKLKRNDSNWDACKDQLIKAFIDFIPDAYLEAHKNLAPQDIGSWSQITSEKRKKIIQNVFEADQRVGYLFAPSTNSQGGIIENPHITEIINVVEESLKSNALRTKSSP